MKDYKWTRGLSKSTISNVLDCNPLAVDFEVDRKLNTVQCQVYRAGDHGEGLAICSCLDRFDERVGKNIAARRAVLALTEEVNSRRVRDLWDSFPDTWTKKRINHLKRFSGIPKCYYGKERD